MKSIFVALIMIMIIVINIPNSVLGQNRVSFWYEDPEYKEWAADPNRDPRFSYVPDPHDVHKANHRNEIDNADRSHNLELQNGAIRSYNSKHGTNYTTKQFVPLPPTQYKYPVRVYKSSHINTDPGTIPGPGEEYEGRSVYTENPYWEKDDIYHYGYSPNKKSSGSGRYNSKDYDDYDQSEEDSRGNKYRFRKDY